MLACFHTMLLKLKIIYIFFNLEIVLCVCVCIQQLSHVQLVATSWRVACQAPLSMEFSRQEYQSRLPFPTLWYLRDPGIETTSLVSPALAGKFFTTSASWET